VTEYTFSDSMIIIEKRVLSIIFIGMKATDFSSLIPMIASSQRTSHETTPVGICIPDFAA